MRNPRLNLIPVLAAIAETGSVNAAARHLALSQSAVSHALARLRDVVGDPLFTRSGRGLVPTPRARAMFGPAKDLLVAAEALFSPQSFTPATDRRRFLVATSDYASLTILPPLMRILNREAPHARLDTTAVGPDTLRQMEQGEVEMSFWGTTAPSEPFHALRLYRERFVGVAREHHPVFGPGSARVSLKSYLAFPHVVLSLRVPGANAVERALIARGKTRRIACTSQSFAGNMEMLRQSDLLATLPARLLANRQMSRGLRSFALPLAVPAYDYRLVWHHRTHADPSLRWLRAAIERAAMADEGR